MVGNIQIREADRQDIPAILALYAQLDGDPAPALDLARAEELWAVIERYPDYRVHVAESDGRVVGTFSLLVVVALSHRGVPGAVVEAVVVDESCRSRGVGEAMMRHAMDLARAKGCYKVALSSSSRREDAHRFYDNLGFRRHGVSFLVELEERNA